MLLPERPSPKTSRCGSASASRATGASCRSSTPSSSRRSPVPELVAGLGAHGVEVDPLGQEPQPGAARPGPAGRDAGDEVLDAVAERGGAGVAVDPRQRGEEVQRPGDQAAAGASGRHQRRRPAVDLGVQRIAETQLEPGAEQVAHGGPEVRPAAGRRHHVQAERQPPGGELVQLDLEVVEVGAQRAPAVHDEEDVAVPVVDLARRAARPVGLDRVDAPGAEAGLAAVHDALHLGDDPAYDVGVGPRADPGDVGEPGERRERAAAEVEDVDAGLLRRRRQRQAGHDRPQQRALAAPRTADHGDVTAGAAQVGGERVAALLPGAVDGAERDDQAVEVPPPVGDQTEVRVRGEVAHQPVERVGPVERGQPDLVRGRSVARQPPHGEVEQRLLLVGGRRLGAPGRRPRAGAPRRAPNGRTPGRPPSVRRAAVRPAGGGPDT